jgi:non-heme chloroperoxidase
MAVLDILTSDGVAVHVERSGLGRPVLFVPGWSMPGSVFAAQRNDLDIDHDVLVLDPRGQGQSERTEQGQYLERRALDIGDVIEALDLTDVTLVGWSIAIGEVLSYVAQYGTARLRGIVLIDGMISPPIEQIGPVHQFLRGFHHDRGGWTAAFIASIAPPSMDVEERNALAAESMKLPAASGYGLLLDAYLIDHASALATVDVPLLFAYQTGAASQAPIVTRHAPHAVTIEFAGASHMMFAEQPDRFNECLRQFMAGTEPPL